ncbi:ABC transporter permease [Bacteroidales bacterium]|nr:ABC transporter permease [Bacteroidales bacterium]
MLFIKLILRNLIKEKELNAINIGGLAIAITACLFIFSYVHHHFSYDKHVPNYENTYRIISQVGGGDYRASTFGCFAEAFNNSNDINDLCFSIMPTNAIVNIDEKMYTFSEVAITNSNFFQFFGVNMLEGNPDKLNEPNMVFLSESSAKKAFPDKSAIGEKIYLRTFENFNRDSIGYFTVAGIYNDIPKTAHFGAEMMFSEKGKFKGFINFSKNSKVFSSRVYVKTQSGAVTSQIDSSLSSAIAPMVKGKPGPPLEAFNFKLQPIKKIHTSEQLMSDTQTTVKSSSLYILLSVGILILCIALINFTNITIAQKQRQQTIFGISKSLGSGKKQIITMAMLEISMVTLLSFLLATVLFIGVLKLSPNLFSQELTVLPGFRILLLYGLGMFTFILGISSLVNIKSVQKVSVVNLISKKSATVMNLKPSAILNVCQIAAVILMVSFTILLFKQLRFIQHKELGFTAENVMVVPFPNRDIKSDIVKERMRKIPGVINAATMHHHPTHRIQHMGNIPNGPFSSMDFGFADSESFDVLGIDVIKSFVPSLENTKNGVVINETFYNRMIKEHSESKILSPYFLGLTDDRGKPVPMSIAAVVRDFHYKSLHDQIGNFMYILRQSNNQFLLVKVANPETITSVVKSLEEIYTGLPILFDLLDTKLYANYKAELTLSKLIQVFAIIACIIACLGLLGFSIHATRTGTKEIGVRKVAGATISEILILLNKKYVRWVAIAFVVACPLALLGIRKWLENFAYQTPISWWIFALAGAIALIIALVTVSWHSWRAANRNPIEALRYE